jgi:hypothetical protein
VADVGGIVNIYDIQFVSKEGGDICVFVSNLPCSTES